MSTNEIAVPAQDVQAPAKVRYHFWLSAEFVRNFAVPRETTMTLPNGQVVTQVINSRTCHGWLSDVIDLPADGSCGRKEVMDWALGKLLDALAEKEGFRFELYEATIHGFDVQRDALT
jgi:hypothetical protein